MRRNSPNDIPDLGDLTNLSDFVFDKRQSQRTAAKRHRRNRHDEKQFIRNALTQRPRVDSSIVDTPDFPLLPLDPLQHEVES